MQQHCCAEESLKQQAKPAQPLPSQTAEFAALPVGKDDPNSKVAHVEDDENSHRVSLAIPELDKVLLEFPTDDGGYDKAADVHSPSNQAADLRFEEASEEADMENSFHGDDFHKAKANRSKLRDEEAVAHDFPNQHDYRTSCVSVFLQIGKLMPSKCVLKRRRPQRNSGHSFRC